MVVVSFACVVFVLALFHFIVVFLVVSHAISLYSVSTTSSRMEESIKVGCCFFCMCCLCFGFVSFDCCFLAVSHAISLYSVYSSSSTSSIHLRWMVEESIKVGCCFFCLCCLCFGFVSFYCCVFGCFSCNFTLFIFLFLLQPFLDSHVIWQHG